MCCFKAFQFASNDGWLLKPIALWRCSKHRRFFRLQHQRVFYAARLDATIPARSWLTTNQRRWNANPTFLWWKMSCFYMVNEEQIDHSTAFVACEAPAQHPHEEHLWNIVAVFFWFWLHRSTHFFLRRSSWRWSDSCTWTLAMWTKGMWRRMAWGPWDDELVISTGYRTLVSCFNSHWMVDFDIRFFGAGNGVECPLCIYIYMYICEAPENQFQVPLDRPVVLHFQSKHFYLSIYLSKSIYLNLSIYLSKSIYLNLSKSI